MFLKFILIVVFCIIGLILLGIRKRFFFFGGKNGRLDFVSYKYKNIDVVKIFLFNNNYFNFCIINVRRNFVILK